MMKALAVVLCLFVTISAQAATQKCAELKSELKAMKAAQSQVINSLVSNHETFASSMEEFSESVKDSSETSSSKAISANMNETAKAFRQRGVQGQRMAGRLDKATDDLIARVAACLK